MATPVALGKRLLPWRFNALFIRPNKCSFYIYLSWAWENPDGPAPTPGDGELLLSPCLVSDRA